MFHKIHRYLEDLIPERPEVLREMEREAAERDFPIVGPLVGRYLYQTAVARKARTVLELGSGFGYSAFWFSMALKGKGEILLTDLDKANKRRAFDYFKEAGLQTQFDFRVGNAINIARRLDGPYDIIFNDIDKADYTKAIDIAARLLRKGGLFITDNVIWSGRVCDKNPDATTRAIMTFNEELMRDSRFFTTILPIRDGLAVALRL